WNGSNWDLVRDSGVIPAGYRKTVDFYSGEKIYVPLFGHGAGGAGNSEPAPVRTPNLNFGQGLGAVQPQQQTVTQRLLQDPNKITPGLVFVGPGSNDVNSTPAPGSDTFKPRTVNSAAIFG